MHIPLVEYLTLYSEYEFFGDKGEEICCPSVNTGLFSAIIEQPTVDWVACGHDHNNDFYGQYQGVMLSYARKT